MTAFLGGGHAFSMPMLRQIGLWPAEFFFGHEESDLARRRLPVPLVPVHLGVWILRTVARTRSLAGLNAWWGGFVEGVRTPCGPRGPMKWRTVWRMTRLGRPPIL